MISLRLEIEPLPLAEPMIVRLLDNEPQEPDAHDAILIGRDGDRREYDLSGFSLAVHASSLDTLDGDVLLILPGQKSAHRLVRASSRHNTFLVTERCDQLCVMCSQPPKSYDFDLFDQFAQAAILAPNGAYIGISGGEPTLLKDRLFDFLSHVAAVRPDLRFHILTNAQHFDDSDMARLSDIGLDRVLWGIPLYAADAATHDAIVGKPGAFRKLEASLALLMRSGASVELRTVVMRQNGGDLPRLADYVATRTPFVSSWALMQLERIGYGRMNWDKSFLDTSLDFANVARAVNVARGRGLNVQLYNFPLCSVPPAYCGLAPSTISDWKRKYLEFCGSCAARSACGGFFEWYSHPQGFAALGPL